MSIIQRLKNINEGNDEEYKRIFRKCLAKFGVKSPEDLTDAQKAEFYKEVDAKWNSKAEPGEDGPTKK